MNQKTGLAQAAEPDAPKGVAEFLNPVLHVLKGLWAGPPDEQPVILKGELEPSRKIE